MAKTLDEEFQELAFLEINAIEKGLAEIKECNERMINSLNILRAYVKAAGPNSKVWKIDKSGWQTRAKELEYDNIDTTIERQKGWDLV